MRIKAVIIALGVVLALSNGLASAQPQRTDTCVRGIADAYRFTTNLFTQHEIRLTANRNNPGIFFLVFDSDADLVGISSSNTRSVHWSSGLLRGRHEVWVGCLRASSLYDPMGQRERKKARSGAVYFPTSTVSISPLNHPHKQSSLTCTWSRYFSGRITGSWRLNSLNSRARKLDAESRPNPRPG